jgi:L-lactate dehydrogenase (cytochrome)
MAAERPSLSGIFASLRSVVRFRRFELDPEKRRLARVASVDDLRAVARRRLPRGVFDYIDGAAEDEISLAANSDAYRRIRFRPRVLRDVSGVNPATTLLGRPVSLPLVIAPTGRLPSRGWRLEPAFLTRSRRSARAPSKKSRR